MKYRDNKFIKYQDKQRFGDLDYYENKSERQIRREKKFEHSKFYMRFLQKYVDKYWWVNLKESDKDRIISLYDDEIDVNMIEFVEYIKSNFTPNRPGLREDRLKAIGL